MKALSAAVKAGNVPSLKRLSFADSEISGALPLLFTNRWPVLEHLELWNSILFLEDLDALFIALGSTNSKKAFPSLNSLTLSDKRGFSHIKDIVSNHPLKDLRNLAVGNLTRAQLKDVFCSGTLSNLSELSLSNCLSDSTYQLRHGRIKWDLPVLQSLSLNRCRSSFSPEISDVSCHQLLHLEVRECSGCCGMLEKLLLKLTSRLHTLILSDCQLRPDDLQTLAKASTKGQLSSLSYLDISQNKQLKGHIKILFTHGTNWDSLAYLNIEIFERWLKDEEVYSTDAKTVFDQIHSGVLKSLTKFYFTTGGEQPFLFLVESETDLKFTSLRMNFCIYNRAPKHTRNAEGLGSSGHVSSVAYPPRWYQFCRR